MNDTTESEGKTSAAHSLTFGTEKLLHEAELLMSLATEKSDDGDVRNGDGLQNEVEEAPSSAPSIRSTASSTPKLSAEALESWVGPLTTALIKTAMSCSNCSTEIAAHMGDLATSPCPSSSGAGAKISLPSEVALASVLEPYQTRTVPSDGGNPPKPKTVEPNEYTNNRLYVSNIPFSFREKNLMDLFKPFGAVQEAVIVCNDRGSKGFGFVSMDSVENCENARRALNGVKLLGRVIEVRKATCPPNKRRLSNLSQAPSPVRSVITPGAPLPTTPSPSPAAKVQHITGSQAILPNRPNSLSIAPAPPPPNPHMQAAAAVLLQNNVNAMLQSYLTPSAPLLTYGLAQPPCMLPPFGFNGMQFPMFSFVPPSSNFTYQVPRGMPLGPLTRHPVPTTAGVPQVTTEPFDQSFNAPFGVRLPPKAGSPIPSGSLNNTFNGSMNAHNLLLQDQLVNMLNLDGTMNNASRLSDNSHFSLSSGQSSDVSVDSNDSRGRKRNASNTEELNFSAAKILRP